MLSGHSAGVFQSSLEAVCSDWSQEGGPRSDSGTHQMNLLDPYLAEIKT